MRVLSSTLCAAMSRLYKAVIEPSAGLMDEQLLENEWVLVTGLRRSDFRQVMSDMKRKAWVVERSHGTRQWIEVTYEGVAQFNSAPRGGLWQQYQDWATLKRASRRRFKLSQIGHVNRHQRILDSSSLKR